jgi:hypothetical protein
VVFTSQVAIEKAAIAGGLFIYAGNHLRSHTLTRAVPSAQRGLTSVFGMGTGVTLAVYSPANLRGAWRRVVPRSRARPRLVFLQILARQAGAVQLDFSQRNRLGGTRLVERLSDTAQS